MTLRGNTSQACAACKYQRRKCTPDCPLAPYFPPDQPKMFQNVHKLFGVKKIQKILEHLHPTQHHEAMSSLIYQANVRDRYPVLGCVEVIQMLKHQIKLSENELFAVNFQLAMYQNQDLQGHHAAFVGINESASQPELQLGISVQETGINDNNMNGVLQFSLQNPGHDHVLHFGNGVGPGPVVSQNHSYSSSNSGNNSSYVDGKETALVNSMWVHQQYQYESSENNNSEDNNINHTNNNNNNNNNNQMTIQSQLVISESPPVVVVNQTDAYQDYDEMNPYFDSIVDRQSFVDSKQPYESSPESSSIKDTTQSLEHILPENELKNAAACFRLTSVI